MSKEGIIVGGIVSVMLEIIEISLEQNINFNHLATITMDFLYLATNVQNIGRMLKKLQNIL